MICKIAFVWKGGGLKNIFVSQIKPTNSKIKEVHLYMDVNEDETLSNFTIRRK